jgi:hypothetical protein
MIKRPATRKPGDERVLPLFVVAVSLLSPPAMVLWSAPERPWWLVFAFWAVLVLLIRYAVGRTPP